MRKWICSVFLAAIILLGINVPASMDFTINVEELKPSDKNDVT